MKITIKGQEIELKSRMRAYLIYEKLTDKTFKPQSITDIVIYFYSVIIGNAKDLELTFEEFLDFLDEEPELMEEFNRWILEENKRHNQFTDVKKKVAKKK